MKWKICHSRLLPHKFLDVKYSYSTLIKLSLEMPVLHDKIRHWSSLFDCSVWKETRSGAATTTTLTMETSKGTSYGTSHETEGRQSRIVESPLHHLACHEFKPSNNSASTPHLRMNPLMTLTAAFITTTLIGKGIEITLYNCKSHK